MTLEQYKLDLDKNIDLYFEKYSKFLTETLALNIEDYSKISEILYEKIKHYEGLVTSDIYLRTPLNVSRLNEHMRFDLFSYVNPKYTQFYNLTEQKLNLLFQ